ncbi:MAG: hypothetical protein M1832_003795 [Thelocarpon impressellum]|nr:MAG: hypothetical protein M1832_003795 [Thelocarpon impressellum]
MPFRPPPSLAKQASKLPRSRHAFSSASASLADGDAKASLFREPPLDPDTPSQDRRTSSIFSITRDIASQLSASEATRREERAASASRLASFGRAVDLEKQLPRRWQAGDVYAPHDLSPAEMSKWKRRVRPGQDAFDVLGVNALHEYKNFAMMSEYMTDMGRIRHRADTGLRAVNQRRVARAVRRAIGIGIMPSVHRHPEILEIQANRYGGRGRAV